MRTDIAKWRKRITRNKTYRAAIAAKKQYQNTLAWFWYSGYKNSGLSKIKSSVTPLLLTWYHTFYKGVFEKKGKFGLWSFSYSYSRKLCPSLCWTMLIRTVLLIPILPWFMTYRSGDKCHKMTYVRWYGCHKPYRNSFEFFFGPNYYSYRQLMYSFKFVLL